ncbi:MAG TPA: oxidoreductase [Anaeromyxobacteraceae bacterium]|nr:oxidoreductase [Anaeromyxobacteraceae bacterium]
MATAWLAGATGLVGGVLLRELLDDAHFQVIVSFGRRPVPIQHPKLVQVETDFVAVSVFDGVAAPSVAFSCLGTTLRKAGSREAFRKVDHDAVLAFAAAARRRGAQAFLHVSSLGANVRSRAFYSAVKGETERDVARLGFPSVHALRPSILDGDRQESRPAERLGLGVGRALAPLLGKYRPTPVTTVAGAMIARARSPSPGVHAIEPDEM